MRGRNYTACGGGLETGRLAPEGGGKQHLEDKSMWDPSFRFLRLAAKRASNVLSAGNARLKTQRRELENKRKHLEVADWHRRPGRQDGRMPTDELEGKAVTVAGQAWAHAPFELFGTDSSSHFARTRAPLLP